MRYFRIIHFWKISRISLHIGAFFPEEIYSYQRKVHWSISQMDKDRLRRKAEEHLTAKDRHVESMERADLERLTHELAVHQIELEIQNEDLHHARIEAEEVRDRYLDLYDFAPVGYFTLEEHNRITEANLTGCKLLKIDRNNLLKQTFTKFISPLETDRFYEQRKRVMESGIRQTGELQMRKEDGTAFYAQIESLKVGVERLRLAVMDVTERRIVEPKIQEGTEELAQSEKKYRTLFNSIDEGFCIIEMLFDSKGKPVD